MIAPERRAELDRMCVCGHPSGRHFGDGPCIAAHGDGKRASVCACTRFRAVIQAHARRPTHGRRRTPSSGMPESWAAARPMAGRDRRAAAPTTDVRTCSSSTKKYPCKTPATVILVRDGKPYCRPHGLALALKLPRSSIRPIDVQEVIAA